MRLDMMALMGVYLRAQPGIGRVVSKPPAGTAMDTAWVRLTQVNAADEANSDADHLIEYDLQLDCCAGKTGGIQEAMSLGASVVGALKLARLAAINGVVVTGVRASGPSYIPDEGIEPARDRGIVLAQVWAHPKPGG